MLFTRHSLIMTLLTFTLLAIIGGYVTRCTNWHSIKFSFVIILLSIFRCLIPIEFFHITVIVTDYTIYPLIDCFLRLKVYANCQVLHILCFISLIGSIIYFVYLAFCLYKQWVLLQCCALPKSHPLYKVCHESASYLGMSYTGTIGISYDFSVPTMIGLFHPNIIVPIDVETISTEQLYYIFYHELYHFKKKDLWIKLGVKILCGILWWNPAVYFLKNGIDHMLEVRCDRNVCCLLTKKEQVYYGDTLLQMLKKQTIPRKIIGSGYSGKGNDKNITHRFKHIISNDKKEKSPVFVFLILLSITLFILSYKFMLQPYFAPPSIENETNMNTTSNNFILRKEDGTLEYYVDGFHRGNLTEEMLKEEPYYNISIYDSD